LVSQLTFSTPQLPIGILLPATYRKRIKYLGSDSWFSLRTLAPAGRIRNEERDFGLVIIISLLGWFNSQFIRKSEKNANALGNLEKASEISSLLSPAHILS
jgi:hypothetical protein